MVATAKRIHIPGLGEGTISTGSGYPFKAYDGLPGGWSVGDIITIGKSSFAVAKAGGAISSTGLACKNDLSQGVANSAVAAVAAAGATAVILTTSATSGALGTGAIAEDEFKGGDIVLFTTGSDIPQRRGITGNTARVATGSLPVTFTLDSPLTTALGTSDTGEAMQSPWSHVVQDTEISHPVVGVPTVVASSGQYLLLQVTGMTFVSPQAGVGVAGAVACYWRHDGSVDIYANIGTYVTSRLAGYVLSEAAAHTQGAPFLMLAPLV